MVVALVLVQCRQRRRVTVRGLCTVSELQASSECPGAGAVLRLDITDLLAGGLFFLLSPGPLPPHKNNPPFLFECRLRSLFPRTPVSFSDIIISVCFFLPCHQLQPSLARK